MRLWFTNVALIKLILREDKIKVLELSIVGKLQEKICVIIASAISCQQNVASTKVVSFSHYHRQKVQKPHIICLKINCSVRL